MRLSHFLIVPLTALVCAAGVHAEDVANEAPLAAEPAAIDTDEPLAWDQFDDPDFDPAATPPPTPGEADSLAVSPDDAFAEPLDVVEGRFEALDAPVAATATAAAPVANGVVLGPEGVDDQGRKGRLHTVVGGDTLWDLSAAYLGTPWVWPSVWIDNDDIANPHLIVPGDRIWITANEMRVVTDAEAESFLQTAVRGDRRGDRRHARTFAEAELPPVVEEVQPARGAPRPIEDDRLDPRRLPGRDPRSRDRRSKAPVGRMITVARRDSYGFVSADALAGASSHRRQPVADRTFLAEGDRVFVGLGEGDVRGGRPAS